MRMRASFLLSLVLLAACGSSASPGISSGADAKPEDALIGPPIELLRVSEIAIFQAVKVSLAKDGVPNAGPPVVANRDALLRIYVAPEAGWQKRAVLARVKVAYPAAGAEQVRVFETQREVQSASTDATLDSTFNFDLPRDVMIFG